MSTRHRPRLEEMLRLLETGIRDMEAELHRDQSGKRIVERVRAIRYMEERAQALRDRLRK